MQFNIPRSEIEGNEAPEGTHPARIDRVGHHKAPSGNDVLLINWKITGSEPPAGSGVLENITMVPEAYWRLDDLFKAIDFVPGDQGFNSDDLKGAECKLVVVREMYEGRERAKVKSHIHF